MPRSSFADGAGASAAGDFDLARPTEQVFSVPRHADGPAALLAPVPKVALFFLSADGTDTVGLNRYAYCGNDPVNHTDVDGRDKDDTEADQGGGGGGVASWLEDKLDSVVDAARDAAKRFTNCKHAACKWADKAEKFVGVASAFEDGYDAAHRAYDKAPYGAEGREAAQAFILHTAGSWIDGKTGGMASLALAGLRTPAGPSTPLPAVSPAERAQAQAQTAAENEKNFSDRMAKSRRLDAELEASREAAIERDRQERSAQERRAVDLYIHGPH